MLLRGAHKLLYILITLDTGSVTGNEGVPVMNAVSDVRTFTSLELRLQNCSQLTCSHHFTPESIYKSLPSGIVTSDQPCFKHLLELVFCGSEV